MDLGHDHAPIYTILILLTSILGYFLRNLHEQFQEHLRGVANKVDQATWNRFMEEWAVHEELSRAGQAKVAALEAQRVADREGHNAALDAIESRLGRIEGNIDVLLGLQGAKPRRR